MNIERRTVTSRAEWLDWRRLDLTASDIGAVAGFDPYRTPLHVYGTKTGAIAEPIETNLMRRGRWLEPAILAALREALEGWDIQPAGVYLRAPDLRLGATPDFFARDPQDPVHIVNIQGKVVTRATFERDWADDRAPPGYQLQTLAEGMLAGASRSLLAALVIDTYGADLALREVPRHAGAEARVCEIVAQFWDNIARGVRPAPDYGRDAEVIEQLHRHATPESSIDLSGDNRLASLLAARALLKGEISALEAQAKPLDSEIKDKVGTAETVVAGGWKITWKEQTRPAHQVKEWTGRVLRISPVEAR